jgi:hypothetical protein
VQLETEALADYCAPRYGPARHSSKRVAPRRRAMRQRLVKAVSAGPGAQAGIPYFRVLSVSFLPLLVQPEGGARVIQGVLDHVLDVR